MNLEELDSSRDGEMPPFYIWLNPVFPQHTPMKAPEDSRVQPPTKKKATGAPVRLSETLWEQNGSRASF